MLKVNLNKVAIGFIVVVLGAVVGCGSSGTNNDQGSTLTFLGYFRELSTDCGEFPEGLSGVDLQLGASGPEPIVGTGEESGAEVLPSSSFAAVVGLQNNLNGQIVRIDRMFLDFYIPGAESQPPSTTVPISMILGPADNSESGTTTSTEDGFDSSLPPGFANTCNQQYSQTLILPASVRSWINLNREALPEPPFQMEVRANLTGVASGGNRMTTNTESLVVEILPETFVAPPQASGGDADGGTTDTGTITGDDAVDLSTLPAEDAGVDGLTDIFPDDGSTSGDVPVEDLAAL